MEKNAMAISITVDPPTGNITVDPTVANFHPGDMVIWNVVNGTSLTISFKTNSPFTQVQLQGPGNVEKGIPQNSPLGLRYHYSVNAVVGGKTYVVPGCPEIVIE
jgi:hypothetical protein